MVIVDTSVLIDYLADRVTPATEWLERQIDIQRIGITTLVLAEVLQGIRADDQFVETLRVLKRFAVFETSGVDLALASARNYRTLRRMGITVRSTIDCIIATFCIEEEHSLLHNDRDFEPFEAHLGLKILDPPPLHMN
jgi:hypothetical protein